LEGFALPWCPKCSTEYREGFTQCSDCLTDLVDNLQEIEKTTLTKRIAQRVDILIPAQRSQSLLNVTAFFIVYSTCCGFIQNIANNISWAYYYFTIMDIVSGLLLPICFNIVFFTGAYAVIHRANVKQYLNKRNILINASLTLAQKCFDIVSGYIASLVFSKNEYLFDQFGTELYAVIKYINMLSIFEVIALAIIYVLTIRNTSLKRVLFSKMAFYFYLIMLLASAIQIYNYHLLFPFFSDQSVIDYSAMIMRLYLLWFGVFNAKSEDSDNLIMS
jgi:hypothetical protein